MAAHSNRGSLVFGVMAVWHICSIFIKGASDGIGNYCSRQNINKLSHFSFVDKTYLADYLPSDFEVDHAFECVGGEGSYFAIDDIIRYINPQGTVMLLGVSENKVPIYTRDILEKVKLYWMQSFR